MRSAAFASPMLNAGLIFATLVWNAWLFVQVAKRGWFTSGLAWIDVLWTCVVVIAVTQNSGVAYDESAVNWSGRVGQAGAALAGAAFERTGVAVLAVAALLGVHAFATTSVIGDSPELAGELIACLNGLFWFAVVIGFVVRYLRRQGSQLDRLAEERLTAQARHIAEQARHHARLEHYRTLHDTVLSTLAAIARGGLDHRTAEVRARCARDADYVRRLVLDDVGELGTPGERLGRVVTDAEALGLRIHCRLDTVPADTPDTVVEALAGAVREALNNVVLHSGTRTAWVTSSRTNGTLVVRVVDRGVGFAADETAQPNGTAVALTGGDAASRPGERAAARAGRRATGYGLPYSVEGRMRDVGGTAHVSSAPGEGTCVELRWPG
jgi:signal transduction histidine kinase